MRLKRTWSKRSFLKTRCLFLRLKYDYVNLYDIYKFGDIYIPSGKKIMYVKCSLKGACEENIGGKT